LRDLALLLIVFGSLPIILLRPFVGLLVYSWLAYMRPHDMVWGDLPPLSLFVALTMLTGLVLKIGEEKWFKLRPQTVLLITLGLWLGLSSLLAVDPGVARPWAVRMWKLLLIAVLTTGLVQSHRRFRLMYLVIAGSLGLLGLKYGLYVVVRGGGRISSGPGGFFPDSNGLALALCMAIPLIVGAALTESQPAIRKLFVVLAVFSAAAVVFTFSRGGLLALAVVLVILFARSGRPIAVGLVATLALTGILLTTTEKFQQSYMNRASSVSEYKQDESMRGRFREWDIAMQVFSDHPLVGVGPNNLQLVRHFYIHDGSSYLTTHNSFLQMLVACGLPALALFAAALAVSIWRLERLRKNSHLPWARTYASMLQCSLIAYSVGGMLGDGAYFDLTYHLIAMTVSLELAVETAETRVESLELVTSSPNREWWREAPAGG